METCRKIVLLAELYANRYAERYTEALTPSICESDLTWKQGLCRRNRIEKRSYCTHQGCVLVRRGDSETEGGGHLGWRQRSGYAARGHGVPGAPSNQKTTEGSPAEGFRRSVDGPDHLHFRLLVSGTLPGYISVF